MVDQKIDNLLELSLDTPADIREKSENLSAGYDPDEKEWEVIIRYSGDAGELAGRYGRVTALLGGYAVVVLPEEKLGALAAEPRVEYIEKPKALSFAVYEGKAASCIPIVQRAPRNLTGRGVIVAVVDSGIDIFHPDFRNEDGTTRLIGLWDQTVTTGSPPMSYPSGTYFDREAINAALEAGKPAPTIDPSGHGTHVAGIAAGNGRAGRGERRGVAYESDILVVRLAGQSRNGIPQTTGLMMGVDFCVKKAIELSRPIAINLSYGNSYGSHDGTSLIENYLDLAAGLGRTTICIGSGNEGNKRRHAEGRLRSGGEFLSEFTIAPGESGLGIQIWKRYADDFQITLYSPSGARISVSGGAGGYYRYVMDGTELLWYFGGPSPYSTAQEIYLEMLPEGEKSYVRSGVWKLIFTPVKIVEGAFRMWMPSGGSISDETGFLTSDVQRTLTIPSTAFAPITVGAYDGRTESFAAFSGQGFVCCDRVKPDMAAPGVDIVSCSPGGGYTSRSGTSMACPFVTGSAALLMEYGIVKGRDPYLYGQKVKACLIRGAKPLPAYSDYPNGAVGWGALCLADSIPM